MSPPQDDQPRKALDRRRTGYAASALKRGMDVAGAGFGLLALSPVLLGVALAVRFTMGSPVLFRQPRAGLDGAHFEILKFRTMLPASTNAGEPSSDARRLTRLGRFLRASSLDELPELWNVLRGDMSLVGPRPLFTRYLDRYTPLQARRHEVRPGVTGLAQVNGRNALSWEDRFALDVRYVDTASMVLDLKILWLTVLALISRHGISAGDHATMYEYEGVKPDA